jgi:hypothetical protein
LLFGAPERVATELGEEIRILEVQAPDRRARDDDALHRLHCDGGRSVGRGLRRLFVAEEVLRSEVGDDLFTDLRTGRHRAADPNEAGAHDEQRLGRLSFARDHVSLDEGLERRGLHQHPALVFGEVAEVTALQDEVLDRGSRVEILEPLFDLLVLLQRLIEVDLAQLEQLRIAADFDGGLALSAPEQRELTEVVPRFETVDVRDAAIVPERFDDRLSAQHHEEAVAVLPLADCVRSRG